MESLCCLNVCGSNNKIVIVTLLFHYGDLFSPFLWEMEKVTFGSLCYNRSLYVLSLYFNKYTTLKHLSGKNSIWSNTQFFLQFVYVFTGILSATGNGYVIYMTAKRKTKLKPPEFMTLNLAVFDFGISGEFKWLDIMLLMMSSVRCAFSKIEMMYYISERISLWYIRFYLVVCWKYTAFSI